MLNWSRFRWSSISDHFENAIRCKHSLCCYLTVGMLIRCLFSSGYFHRNISIIHQYSFHASKLTPKGWFFALSSFSQPISFPFSLSYTRTTMENTLSMTQLACHRKMYCTFVCLALLISTQIHIFLSLCTIFYHIAKQIMLNRLIWYIWISGAVHKSLSHTRAPKYSFLFQHFDFVYPNEFPLK